MAKGCAARFANVAVECPLVCPPARRPAPSPTRSPAQGLRRFYLHVCRLRVAAAAASVHPGRHGERAPAHWAEHSARPSAWLSNALPRPSRLFTSTHRTYPSEVLGLISGWLAAPGGFCLCCWSSLWWGWRPPVALCLFLILQLQNVSFPFRRGRETSSPRALPTVSMVAPLRVYASF